MNESQPGGFKQGVARTMSALTSALGSFPAFTVAVGVILTWGVGLAFIKGGFSNNTYQLFINTGTTIVTFIMVFIIQNTTNRESRAMQVKLDAALTNQRNLAHLVTVLLKQHFPEGLPGHIEVLADDLMGLEEEPEASIKEAQEEVREA